MTELEKYSFRVGGGLTDQLVQWLKKVWPLTGSTGIDWELGRHVHSQAPPGPPEAEALGEGACTICVSTCLPGDSVAAQVSEP